jgi:hypothetical protein
MLDKTKERWPEMDIKYLVLEEDDFMVCIDSEMVVDWNTNEKFQGHKDETKHNGVLNRMALLESIPIYALHEQIRLSYKRMLGEAIARSLSGDYNNALNILDAAETFITSRNGELARTWYLSASGVTTGLLVLLSLPLWFGRVTVKCMIGEVLFWLMIASIAGAVGAMFSVIMRMGNAKLDCSAGMKLHILESISRIAAGMISALLVGLTIYSGVLLPALAQTGNKRAFIVLAALVAGASERWAPSLIEHVEKRTKVAGLKQQLSGGGNE